MDSPASQFSWRPQRTVLFTALAVIVTAAVVAELVVCAQTPYDCGHRKALSDYVFSVRGGHAHGCRYARLMSLQRQVALSVGMYLQSEGKAPSTIDELVREGYIKRWETHDISDDIESLGYSVAFAPAPDGVFLLATSVIDSKVLVLRVSWDGAHYSRVGHVDLPQAE